MTLRQIPTLLSQLSTDNSNFHILHSKYGFHMEFQVKNEESMHPILLIKSNLKIKEIIANDDNSNLKNFSSLFLFQLSDMYYFNALSIQVNAFISY